MISVQWALVNSKGLPLIMTMGAIVPEKISLLQFWKFIIAPRYPVPSKHVAWGNPYRDGRAVENGKVTSLTEPDSVEIIVEEGKKPTQQEASYVIGDQPQVFKIIVRRTLTIGEVKERIALTHKGKPITAVGYAEAEISDDDPSEDWMRRIGTTPFQVRTSMVTQVILSWRGTETPMTARESWTKKEFTEAAKQHLYHTGRVRIEPQGLSTWEIRAGFRYDVIETKKMYINLHDTDWKVHKLQSEGDRSLEEVAGFPAWNKVIIQRQDGQPFWIENKAHCTLVTQCDPNSDPRQLVSVRIDATDRSYLLANVRVDDDPVEFMTSMSAKLGLPFRSLDNVSSLHSTRELTARK
jgi:hypothetical protein